jgi:hypothetical protein
MQGCGRRSALRIVVAIATVALALFASVQASLAATNPLTLTLQVGYHNNVKLGQWMPVSVDVTNSGPDFEGMLEVQASNTAGGGPPIGIAVYQAPVTLASGATKHFRTYVSQDFPGSVQATLVQNGHAVASQSSSAASTFSGLMAGILSDQPSTLDGLSSLHPAGSAPLVVHLAAADLSDSAPVLRAFDMIAIDDFATDTLTAGQKTVLSDYVMQGGALLLGSGGAWHKTLGGLPAGLVPMQVTGSTVLPAVTALGGARNVEIATGTLTAGASAWVAEGDRPLLIEAPEGKGVVTMATFDWAQDSVAGWAGLVPILRQVLVRATYGNLSNPTSTGPAIAKFGAGTSISLATKGGALAQGLGNLPALDLPAWWLIGTLVFAYVLLVGPVNYFVLRATGRRALAWITVPAIALVASAGAYGISLATKGTSVLANEVSVIHVEPGGDRAYQEEYTGIMTPTRGDYQVAVSNGRTLISPIYYYTGNMGDPNSAAVRINTVSSDVTLPGMTAFTLRGFANEGILANAPHLSGQAQMSGGQLTGSVTNSSTIRFTDGVVISGNSYQKLNALAPGQTLSFSLQPTNVGYTGPPIGMNIYPSNYQFNGAPPNNSTDVERQMEIRSGVLSTLIPNAFGGMVVSTRPIVVLWTQQPFQEVTVNGAHPRTFVESAVVLTLPIQRVASGALPAGVVQGRLVDIDADTSQGGPPGMVVAQKGSLTYSFAPALGPGTRLTAASITNVNPFGSKGYIGPTGTASVVKAQAWDWTQGAWVDVSYNDTGATTIPSADVNPTTGEVRLKLSSDGQFATGWLSLSGTVG